MYSNFYIPSNLKPLSLRNKFVSICLNLKVVSVIFLLVSLFVGTTQPLRSEPVAIRVGEILVPPPKSMVEVSDYSNHYRTLFKALPKQSFGLYYLVAEFDDVSSGKIPAASQSAFGVVSSFAATELEAATHHKKMMADLERDAAAQKTSSEEFQILVQEGKKKVESNQPWLKVDIEGMTVLDVDTSKPSKGSCTWVMNNALVTGGKQFKITVISVHGWLKIHRTIMHLAYNMILEDSSTPTKAKNELEAWMAAIEAKNAR